MAIIKKEKATPVALLVKVRRATDFGKGKIGFDADINGLTVYGLTHITYRDKETGKEKTFISMPQKAGKNGKYYNVVYIPFADADIEDIEKQISDLLYM